MRHLRQSLALVLGFAFSICSAQPFTQGTLSIAAELTDIRDNAFSGTASMTWGERTQKEVKIAKSGETMVMTGPQGDVVIHDSMAINFVLTGTAPSTFNTVKTDFTGVETGKKWSSDYTFTQAPASWCPSSNEMTITSTFKAGDKQPFELTINGEKKSIEVIPIYERGYWKRCYSSKVLRKLMYSKELNTVVSVESAMYSVATGKPGAVYSLLVTELK